ncbi:GNAT family N-acetyltransferase [Aurantivibrio plasticivorans]
MDTSIDFIEDPAVIRLLKEQLADMQITSPPESRHALTFEKLKYRDVTCWVARDKLNVLGCAALKELNSQNGDIKSMRTARESRDRGVAWALLSIIMVGNWKHAILTKPGGCASVRGLCIASLFAAYSEDSNGCYMTKRFCAD